MMPTHFQIKQCLSRIAGMTVQEVHKHYGFYEEMVAQNLKTRATGGKWGSGFAIEGCQVGWDRCGNYRLVWC